jgi:hypothetical protein
MAAGGQQPAVPVIGYLGAQSADDYKNFTVPFLQGLKETGYIDGQNVAVEYRWAENQYDRLPALAADLVRRRVAAIVAPTSPAALAAKAATTTIPIVFTTGGDPVALGLVASLNRPGANVTGIANLAAELTPKRLQLLRELIPNATMFGVLADPAFPATRSIIMDLQAAARALGLQLVVVNARTDSDFEIAFDAWRDSPPDPKEGTAAAKILPPGAVQKFIGINPGDACTIDGRAGSYQDGGDGLLYCRPHALGAPARVPPTNPSSVDAAPPRMMDAATAQKIRDQAYFAYVDEITNAWRTPA